MLKMFSIPPPLFLICVTTLYQFVSSAILFDSRQQQKLGFGQNAKIGANSKNSTPTERAIIEYRNLKKISKFGANSNSTLSDHANASRVPIEYRNLKKSAKIGANSNSTPIDPFARLRRAQPKSAAVNSENSVKIQPQLPPYGPVPWDLYERIGNDEFQIRAYLRADAHNRRLHPLQFDVERFKQEVIRIHNRYRWLHTVEAVVRDARAERDAQRWADTLAQGGSCLEHELKHGGENLWMFSNIEHALASPALMAEGCMRTFYIEGRAYYAQQQDAAPPHAVPSAFHFTQLLWRASRRVGVGVAVRALRAGSGPCVPTAGGGPAAAADSSAWMFYVVLRYDPVGNQANPGDGYAQNVLPMMMVRSRKM